MARPSSRDNSNDSSDHDNRTLSPNSDASAPLLGADAEALILCNQKLQELGIDSTIKLPQICVVGNQSTGKSSLIEAISTVKVPKAHGLCTQCPIAINLSAGPHPNSPWTCAVYIERRYDYIQSYPRRAQSKDDSLGPWQERPSIKIIHVKTTNDKDEVTDLIRAAQFAILNPGSRHQDYLVQGDEEERQRPLTMFSPNVIRLDISEASWPNLSFVDLPGVIANTGANEKDRHLVGMIRNLVKKYARDDRSINMLTLPMDHDIANSTACAMIQDLKVEDRTLAVFTKADKMDKDKRTAFLNQHLGKEDDLGFHHGYHFVIMPEHTDLDEARKKESSLFAQEPWIQLGSPFKAQLGVPALTAHLRKVLFEKTRDTLPSNLKSIETRLANIDRQLQDLPEPTNPVLLPLQLQQTVTRFETAMKMLFSGELTGRSISAIMEWTQSIENFRNAINKAKPTVFLESRTELIRLRRAESAIDALRSHNGSNRENAMICSSDEDDSRPPIKAENSAEPRFDPVHRFRFDEIRDINRRFYQACVPGEIELRAIQEMHRLSVKYWDKLLTKFMNECSKMLNKQVVGVLDDIFKEYSHLKLYQVIKDHVKEYLDRAFQHEWDATEELCRIERETPMTCQLDSLKEKESKCLHERLQKRALKRIELATAELNAYEGVDKRRKEAELNIPQADPYSTELLMATKTRAYYEVASARFTDNINSRILGCLLPACNEKLVNSLKQFLGLNDHTRHDQIVEWMTEDPAREQKRRQLLHERKQLTEGLRYIQDVLGSNGTILKRSLSSAARSAHQSTSPTKRAKVAQTNKADANSVTSTPIKLSKRINRMDLDREDA